MHPDSFVHTLTEIDEEGRQAICASCGSVTIKKSGRQRSGKQRWRCQWSDVLPVAEFLVCRGQCGERLPSDAFGKRGNGLDIWCKKCRAEYAREWRQKNPGRWKRYRKLYGLSQDEFERLSQEPCPICFGTEQAMCVDHDHQTNRVRGVICVRCNIGIGALGDTVENVGRAYAYLSLSTPV